MSNYHSLVVTGDVLPGLTPGPVWSRLAEDFGMTPEKLTQLQARMPQIIQRESDSSKLETLQKRIAQCGAQTEIYPPDGCPALFVLIDNAPRGPVPRALVERYLERGVWAADAIRVAEDGSNRWVPYTELDNTLSLAPLPVRPPVSMPSASSSARVVAPSAPATPVLALGATTIEPHIFPSGDAIHAGFWRRAAAYWIDCLVFLPLGILSFWIPVLGFFNIIISWLYFALMESSERQATLGKQAMGIKVMDEQGNRISFGRATGRFFSKFISGAILCVGYMMAGWTDRKQALHDTIANTLVVFSTVRSGHPLPEKRPLMPWYGWAANIAVPTVIIIFYITIVISALAAARS